MIDGPGAHYVELHAHSAYSLCDGSDTPATLVARAAELKMPALALTDHDTLAGAVPFAQAARQHGVTPVFGAELTLDSGHHLTLLAADARGWRNLCQLITIGQAGAPKGQAALPRAALADLHQGLIILSGCRNGPAVSALRRLDAPGALAELRWLRDVCGRERAWLEVQHHLHGGDDLLARQLVDLAQQTGLRALATNNVHYARRDGRAAHDLLTAVRHHTTLDAAGQHLRANSEYYLKTGARLVPLFFRHPTLLDAPAHVAAMCRVTLDYGLLRRPAPPTRCWRATARQRWATCTPTTTARRRIGSPRNWASSAARGSATTC